MSSDAQGVSVAKVFDACLPNFGTASTIVFDQRIFPSAGSRQSTRHCTGSLGVDAMPQVENDITPPMPLGLSALGPTAVVR